MEGKDHTVLKRKETCKKTNYTGGVGYNQLVPEVIEMIDLKRPQYNILGFISF
jgi:hypothetical protein